MWAPTAKGRSPRAAPCANTLRSYRRADDWLRPIESARYAAHYRNYHWQYIRQTKQDAYIEIPNGIGPYPSKSDQILDRPRSDGGGNFGRLARTGIMDSYMQKLNDVQLCGIKTHYWRQFLKAFQESSTDAQAYIALERLKRTIQQTTGIASPRARSALAIIAELERLLDYGDDA